MLLKSGCRSQLDPLHILKVRLEGFHDLLESLREDSTTTTRSPIGVSRMIGVQFTKGVMIKEEKSKFAKKRESEF